MSSSVLPPPHILARMHAIPALEANPNLYVREGFGAMYLCGRIDNVTRDEYRAGRITREDFLDRLYVKVGHAQVLPVRQRAYEKCDDGQTHLWILCFYPDRRIVGGDFLILFFYRPRPTLGSAERLCHLCFLADGAPRAIEECRGCHRHHWEYWRYRDVGPFTRIEQRRQDVLTSLGQPGLSRQVFFFSFLLVPDIIFGRNDLEDIEIAFPLP
ncbi:hypothetical protein B0H11DRAFT_2221572 [Mycena galericulata]|nr:hypothetical protein B0H11DRAFT_2221572 [Mycena galericulata]